MPPPLRINYIIGHPHGFQPIDLPEIQAWYDNTTMEYRPPDLHISKSPSARVDQPDDGTWHLEIPASPRHGYHLAQLDDHSALMRRNFPWRPPLTLSMQARVSAQNLPGTWGFGLWNDPFSFMLAYSKLVPRFPTLPHAAWFFHASPQNYLSFEDELPANGFLAATFCSTGIPAPLLAIFSPTLALTLLPATAQLVRRLFRRLVRQDATQLQTSETEWHTYSLQWDVNHVSFSLDDRECLHTRVVPQRPLTLVIWVDNQYAALPPSGRLRYGTLPEPEPAWLELKDIVLVDQA